MNLSFDIARRYLFGKKSTNAINLISGVSILGIMVGTTALILILSVFNGFESMIKASLDSFNPDIKVTPVEGKFFKFNDTVFTRLLALDGVENISKVISEVAFFEYRDEREVGILKGVDSHFNEVTQIDSTIKEGEFIVRSNEESFAVCERILASKLGINIYDPYSQLTIHVPRKKKKGPLGKEFKSREVYPMGVFSLNNTSDKQYIISSFELVNKMLDLKGQCSALEIKINDAANASKVAKSIYEIIGESYLVQNRIEQDAVHLKIMKIEKWVSFLIISFVIFIIVFNLIGSLWMIVLDKKKDIMILKFMGYKRSNIRNIFLNLGLLITFLGIIFGVIIALVLYWIQINYGLIAMLDGYKVQYYPIKVLPMDIIIIILVVSFLGLLAAILPAIKAADLTDELK